MFTFSLCLNLNIKTWTRRLRGKEEAKRNGLRREIGGKVMIVYVSTCSANKPYKFIQMVLPCEYTFKQENLLAQEAIEANQMCI